MQQKKSVSSRRRSRENCSASRGLYRWQHAEVRQAGLWYLTLFCFFYFLFGLFSFLSFLSATVDFIFKSFSLWLCLFFPDFDECIHENA